MLYIPSVGLTEAEDSETSRGPVPVSSDDFESFLDHVMSYDTSYDSQETSRELLETGRASICLEGLDSFEQALNSWATEERPSNAVGCVLEKREAVRNLSKKASDGRLRSYLSENSLQANSMDLERTGSIYRLAR